MTTQFNLCVSGGCTHEAESGQLRTVRTVSDWVAPTAGTEPEQRLRVRLVRGTCRHCNRTYQTTAYDLALASELAQ